MTTLKEALDQLAKGHELDNEQKKLIIDKWQKELGIQPCVDTVSRKTVLNTIRYWWKTAMMAKGEPTLCDSIRDLPPVNLQPKAGHWIPVKFRPLTDEEQEEYPDYCYMADCPMPDDGEEILVSTKNGRVEKDECGFDDGYYLDSGYDWQTDIVAWMPLPEPYKAESEVGVNGNKKYITQK